MRALALTALLCTAVSPAFAQSKKYPPVAPDKDLQAEKHSALWDSTVNPERAPYLKLVRDAKGLAEAGDMKTAFEKLDEAIKRAPKEPDAYVARGRLFLSQKQWAKCAEDLRLADETTKDNDQFARTRLRIDLGACQGRAGFYAAAETTLMRAAANAQMYKGELLMRLGETRIALGKLDEAAEALKAALDQDSIGDLDGHMARWLLALAYDRARKPSEAAHQAQDAKRYDQSLSQVNSPRMPMLGAGDSEYMRGLAYLYAMPRPEYALLYFRRYMTVAADGPWKKRADEHIKEISSMKLPARESITMSGTSNIAINDIQDALQKPLVEMRQCVAKLPGSAFSVSITKVGPRSREVRDRPIWKVPPPGVRASLALTVDGTGAAPDVASVNSCLEKIANRAAVPVPTAPDTHYMVSFIVVSP